VVLPPQRALDPSVAVTCGDGVGFDVLSFDGADDVEWYIEVKRTGLGKSHSS
jgi:hypothetical protein